MIKEKQMKSRKLNSLARNASVALWKVAMCCALPVFSSAAPQSAEKTSETAPSTQKTFATPQQAADALVKATDPFDVPTLKQILGAAGVDLVESEDQVRDKNLAASFAAQAHEKLAVNIDPKNPARAILVVGNRDWPLPIPIVQRDGKWLFDTKAGRGEILFRRIGTNELDAIQISRGYVEAQREYASAKHDGAAVNQYAQRIISTAGKHDGLAWQNPDGTWGGPVGEGIAKALAEGYTDKSQPYHGYLFKVLKGQGPAAPLGQMDFVVNGAMIGGFGFAAAPAEYRITGVKTFIVSHEGIVYEKDLGPDTLKLFRSLELYNPDKTWRPTNAEWPADVEETDAGSAKP
jgi:Protein of unknown function (DUF2950)